VPDFSGDHAVGLSVYQKLKLNVFSIRIDTEMDIEKKPATINADPEPKPRAGHWLNRNVFAFGLTSLFSDFCHEMATSILPQFMQTIGASAAALGSIEGIADAVSSFVKLGAGYRSDKIGHRKTWTVIGYELTTIGIPLFAFALAWPLILVGRVVGWFGRGIRGPLRDAMMADSIAPEDRGKAFGFHRAGDTIGAVIGPLTAFWLLSWLSHHPAIAQTLGEWFPFFAHAPGSSFRIIFLLTVIPGILSVLSLAFLVTEKRRPPNHRLSFWGTLRAMPKEYRTYLLAITVFGIADFAPTLMILRASTVLEPQMGMLEASRWAALLYVLRNVVYAIASFPIGALSDRFHRTRFLAIGYGVAVVTFIGFALTISSLGWFAFLFSLAGIFIAWEDTVEGVIVRDYVNADIAGTAYGMLGVANGIGDLASSMIVGLLWTLVSPSLGFGYAAVIALVGMILMARVPVNVS
jgi:MFS family permease